MRPLTGKARTAQSAATTRHWSWRTARRASSCSLDVSCWPTLGVVVVRVENTQSRSAFDTDETDRRYGFDVLFRYEREDKRAVPAISKPPITFTKEE